jgi:SAM-dependent methyltransferase
MGRLRTVRMNAKTFVFDYGCGPGLLLDQIRSRYEIPERNLGGCDISEAGIERAAARFPRGDFHVGEFPRPRRPIDIAITSEVIEHTADYRKILEWLGQNMRAGGDLIITTPGGTLDPLDHYPGHVQHFTLPRLTAILEELDFTVEVARYWGFPFVTLQKWVTKRNFDRIRDSHMHGEMNWRKKALFTAAYYAYLLHDLVPTGPQIFIHARKNGPVIRLVD